MPGCLVAFIARVLLSANTRATDKTFNRLLHSDFFCSAGAVIKLGLLGVAALNRTLAADCSGFCVGQMSLKSDRNNKE
jgi:hypothetical protein